MEILNEEFNTEANEETTNKINYFMNIPSYIKGSAPRQDVSNNAPTIVPETNFKPAHVAYGAITIKSGTLNIPRFYSINW